MTNLLLSQRTHRNYIAERDDNTQKSIYYQIYFKVDVNPSITFVYSQSHNTISKLNMSKNLIQRYISKDLEDFELNYVTMTPIFERCFFISFLKNEKQVDLY